MLRVRHDLQENYDNYYTGEASEWRRLGAVDKAGNIVKLCGGLEQASVLEIGAGDGAILEILDECSFGKELHALEISESGCRAIECRNLSSLKSVKTFNGYDMPYRNFQFDLAIISHVLEHVEHTREFLYEASRVAKNIFIEVPCEDTFRLSENYKADPTGHINFYSPRTISRLVETCNMKILKREIVNPSKEVYVYRKGKKGIIDYYIKALALYLFPKMATQIFVYHYVLLCSST